MFLNICNDLSNLCHKLETMHRGNSTTNEILERCKLLLNHSNDLSTIRAKYVFPSAEFCGGNCGYRKTVTRMHIPTWPRCWFLLWHRSGSSLLFLLCVQLISWSRCLYLLLNSCRLSPAATTQLLSHVPSVPFCSGDIAVYISTFPRGLRVALLDSPGLHCLDYSTNASFCPTDILTMLWITWAATKQRITLEVWWASSPLS